MKKVLDSMKGALMLTASALSLLACGSSRLSAQEDAFSRSYSYREQQRGYLQGRRYESIKSLAHELDDRAQRTADQASYAGSGRGPYSDRKLYDVIDDFTRRARGFHARMDHYADSPWDVRSEVEKLDDSARRVDKRLRRSPAYDMVANEWAGAMSTLNRMHEILARGEDYRYRDDDRYRRDDDRYRRDDRYPREDRYPPQPDDPYKH